MNLFKGIKGAYGKKNGVKSMMKLKRKQNSWHLCPETSSNFWDKYVKHGLSFQSACGPGILPTLKQEPSICPGHLIIVYDATTDTDFAPATKV